MSWYERSPYSQYRRYCCTRRRSKSCSCYRGNPRSQMACTSVSEGRTPTSGNSLCTVQCLLPPYRPLKRERFRTKHFLDMCVFRTLFSMYCILQAKEVIAKYFKSSERRNERTQEKRETLVKLGHLKLLTRIIRVVSKFYLLQWPCRRCSRPVPNKDVAGVIPI